MEVFAVVAGCLLMGVGVFALATSVLEWSATRPVAPRRLGVARMAELLVAWCEQLGHWPLLVRLGNIGFVGSFSERVRQAFAGGGFTLTRRACVALLTGALVASMVACVVVSQSLIGALVGVVAVCAATGMLVGRHERTLRGAAANQMPEVLRSLSSALGAGKSLPQAIEYVGRNVGEPMGSVFLRTSFEIKGGRSVEEAISSLCQQVDAPGIDLLGTALHISQRTGSPLNDLFSRTARMVSDTVNLRRELEVKTSQVRMSARVVSAMPLVLVCILVLLSPDYRAGLELPLGRACLCLAALMDITALAAIQRLMRRSLM